MNITWNAIDYEEKFSFVHCYGENVLELVEKGNGGLAVDLGCGTGPLTPELKEKGYRVLGIDESAQMVEAARAAHPEITFMQGNALTFSLEERADVIFSNAVFHWIDRDCQKDLAGNLASQLKPGGMLVTEFGGKGCAQAVHSTLEKCFSERGLKYPRVFYFPTIGEYASVLEKAGFRVVFASLFDRPTPQNTQDGLTDWIRMFIKKPFEGMDETSKAEILKETEDRLRSRLYVDGRWYIDYVRIRVKAIRA